MSVIGENRKPARRIGVSLLAAALSACSFAPTVKLPETQTIDTYAAQPLDAQSTEAGGVAQHYELGARPVPEWWRLYGSETLDAWVDEGLRNNASLDAAQHSLNAAHELLKAKVRESELPTLDAGAQVSRQRDLSFGPPTQLYDVYAGQLQLGYTFDLAGAVRHGNRQARAQVDQQSFELDAAKRALAANIVIAAIDAASLAEQTATSEQLANAAQQQATMLAQQYQLGAVSHADALQAQQNAAAVEASLPALREQALRARHALAVLLGRTPDRAPQALRLSELQLPGDVPVSVPSDLLQQRPDVLAAEAAVHAAAEQVGVATANLFPRISLSASMGTEAFEAASLFSGAAAVWGIGASITQPIFHGGALRAQRRAATAEYDASLAQYRQTVLNAFRDVADTLTALDQDAAALQSAQTASAAASAAHAETQARNQLGALAYTTALVSEQRWRNALLSAIQARAARLADTAALFQAMGMPEAPHEKTTPDDDATQAKR